MPTTSPCGNTDGQVDSSGGRSKLEVTFLVSSEYRRHRESRDLMASLTDREPQGQSWGVPTSKSLAGEESAEEPEQSRVAGMKMRRVFCSWFCLSMEGILQWSLVSGFRKGLTISMHAIPS